MLTFAWTPVRTIWVNRRFKPPAITQVDHASRTVAIASYYSATEFVCSHYSPTGSQRPHVTCSTGRWQRAFRASPRNEPTWRERLIQRWLRPESDTGICRGAPLVGKHVSNPCL